MPVNVFLRELFIVPISKLIIEAFYLINKPFRCLIYWIYWYSFWGSSNRWSLVFNLWMVNFNAESIWVLTKLVIIVILSNRLSVSNKSTCSMRSRKLNLWLYLLYVYHVRISLKVDYFDIVLWSDWILLVLCLHDYIVII
jgi:hypothetical protein